MMGIAVELLERVRHLLLGPDNRQEPLDMYQSGLQDH